MPHKQNADQIHLAEIIGDKTGGIKIILRSNIWLITDSPGSNRRPV